MAPQEQAELWMALRDRMTVDWTQMTLQEKKAGESHTMFDKILDTFVIDLDGPGRSLSRRELFISDLPVNVIQVKGRKSNIC